MRFRYYLETAEKLTGQYQSGQPISFFLKNYYRANRRMGSTDRKTVSSLVYGFFRTSGLLSHLPAADHLLAAWFLCHDKSTPLLAALKPEWDKQAGIPATKKLDILAQSYGALNQLDLFPLHEHLSDGIEPASYALSLLQQPDLFLRLRPGAATAIREQLRAASVPFREISPTCLALANATRVEELLEAFTGEYQIQDRSSQSAGDFFRPEPGQHWWDACAGSGGKSLMLHDQEPTVKLHVTDHRPAILRNLRNRFKAAGITEYIAQEADLLRKHPVRNEEFDGIIMDVPCSGSGTWGRTPEMMRAFDPKRIDRYRELQEKMTISVLPFLKPGGALVYITCSVFRKENEAMITFLRQAAGLELEEQALLEGYRHEADTMFVARLLKR